MQDLAGVLLIDKHKGVSSFGIIEHLQRGLREQSGLKRSELPKMGHGGTLDPFATGLLPVCIGRGVKLARYFLGAQKTYEGVMHFGETTVPGDNTAPISERSEVIPHSLEQLQELAKRFTAQPYLQTPPMFSAKKIDGKPLYELAREGKEVEREPKLCHLYEFEILEYQAPDANFRVRSSSGTYVRTLAQDYAKLLGSVALLEELRRTATGNLSVKNAWSTAQILEATAQGRKLDELDCWTPFNMILDGFARVDAHLDEARALFKGQQALLFPLLNRVQVKENSSDTVIAIFHAQELFAVARKTEDVWSLEKVFATTSP